MPPASLCIDLPASKCPCRSASSCDDFGGARCRSVAWARIDGSVSNDRAPHRQRLERLAFLGPVLEHDGRRADGLEPAEDELGTDLRLVGIEGGILRLEGAVPGEVDHPGADPVPMLP